MFSKFLLYPARPPLETHKEKVRESECYHPSIHLIRLVLRLFECEFHFGLWHTRGKRVDKQRGQGPGVPLVHFNVVFLRRHKRPEPSYQAKITDGAIEFTATLALCSKNFDTRLSYPGG